MSDKKQLQVVVTDSPKKQVRINVNSKGDLSLYTHVSFFALIGCSVRLGVDHVMGSNVSGIEDSGSVIFKAFFSNMVGCFFLGLLSASNLSKTGNYAAVYVGISTGLCGSVTTYSKWNQQVALLFVGETRTSMLTLVVAVASIVVGLCAALSFLTFGKDLMKVIKTFQVCNCSKQSDFDDKPEAIKLYSSDEAIVKRGVEDKKEKRSVKRPLNTFPIFLNCFLMSIVLLLVIVFSLGKDNYDALVIPTTILMAPLGASLRFGLSKLNKVCKFPSGTFLANALGSTLLALTHVLKSWVPMSCIGLAMTSAFGSGFLACLTTVSTFMSETQSKRKNGNIKGAYFYVFITFTICQILAITINGVSHSFLEISPRNMTMLVC